MPIINYREGIFFFTFRIMAFTNTLFIEVENVLLVPQLDRAPNYHPRLITEINTICFGDQCGDYRRWVAC